MRLAPPTAPALSGSCHLARVTWLSVEKPQVRRGLPALDRCESVSWDCVVHVRLIPGDNVSTESAEPFLPLLYPFLSILHPCSLCWSFPCVAPWVQVLPGDGGFRGRGMVAHSEPMPLRRTILCPRVSDPVPRVWPVRNALITLGLAL